MSIRFPIYFVISSICEEVFPILLQERQIIMESMNIMHRKVTLLVRPWFWRGRELQEEGMDTESNVVCCCSMIIGV